MLAAAAGSAWLHFTKAFVSNAPRGNEPSSGVCSSTPATALAEAGDTPSMVAETAVALGAGSWRLSAVSTAAGGSVAAHALERAGALDRLIISFWRASFPGRA